MFNNRKWRQIKNRYCIMINELAADFSNNSPNNISEENCVFCLESHSGKTKAT